MFISKEDPPQTKIMIVAILLERLLITAALIATLVLLAGCGPIQHTQLQKAENAH